MEIHIKRSIWFSTENFSSLPLTIDLSFGFTLLTGYDAFSVFFSNKNISFHLTLIRFIYVERKGLWLVENLDFRSVIAQREFQLIFNFNTLKILFRRNGAMKIEIVVHLLDNSHISACRYVINSWNWNRLHFFIIRNVFYVPGNNHEIRKILHKEYNK